MPKRCWRFSKVGSEFRMDSSRNVRRLSVKVVPRASRNEVVGEQGGALKVRLTAPPVEGAANEALVELLAGHFGVRRSKVRILRGANARLKLVEIDGAASDG